MSELLAQQVTSFLPASWGGWSVEATINPPAPSSGEGRQGGWRSPQVSPRVSVGRVRRGRLSHLVGLLVLVVVSLSGLTYAAETLCELGFVQRPMSPPSIVPVALHSSAAAADVVTIQWAGHSSFLIITPGGTTALTDPNSWHQPSVAPDVVTISNEHPTHNQAGAVPGSPRVLRGRSPEGQWLEVSVSLGDLTIKSLPGSGIGSLEQPALNTIFAFRAAGLCIVHLGNLRQPLNEEQRRRIGRPDVLMVPIDGQWTLNYEQVALTIAQLKPAIVLPMHYDFPQHARLFIGFIKDTTAVRTLPERTLKLTRATLPVASEVVVLGYQEQDG